MFSIIRSYCFLLLFLSYDVLCTRISEECVTYNFEENRKTNFTNTYGICLGMSTWEMGEYKSISKESPNRQSSVFITPKTTLSCLSSFKFVITGLGILEVNAYMAPTANTDQITLLVFQSLPGANDATVGNAVLSPNIVNFVPGWQTLRVNIIGIGKHEGYITLLGMASEKSTVLVDSFRYVAPNNDKDSCVIYPEDATTTEITVDLTEIPTTMPITSTTEKPIITNTTKTPEITAANPHETPTTIAPEKPTKITPEIVTTLSPEKLTTIPTGIPTSISPDAPTTIFPEKPTTVAPEKPSTITSEKPTTQSSTITSTSGSSTQRPKLSVSILLIKIQKFFR